MTVAKPIDVADRLGRSLTASETTWVEVLLADAEALIAQRVAISYAQPMVDVIRQIECWAAIRVLRNPDGRSQESISGEYQFSRDASVASGALYISDAEWALLATPGSTAGSGAFTIRTDRPLV